MINWQASTATWVCASSVLAPRCGVQITLGMLNNGLSGHGSLTKTSKATPPNLPLFSPSINAASS